MPRTAGLTVRIFTHERAHVRRRRAAEALVELAPGEAWRMSL